MTDFLGAPATTTESDATALAGSANSFVLLPAGAGKTELIARAVGIAGATGRQLVLTHTHAGVHALRARFNRLGVSPASYTLGTIGGWALKWSASYPGISGVVRAEPKTDGDWHEVYVGLRRILSNSNLTRAIGQSFGGVFIDEYQDCTLSQHEPVKQLATLLPVRVLGDPLQGIFRWTKEAIRWSADVDGTFSALDIEALPWRWQDSNLKLGEWASDIRSALIEGDPIDLRDAPVSWVSKLDRPEQILTLKDLADVQGETVAALFKWAPPCYRLAPMLGGLYGAMDEVESRDLVQRAAELDAAADGIRAAATLADIALSCFTRLPPSVRNAQKRLSEGKIPQLTTKSPIPDLITALRTAAESPTPASFARVAGEFEALTSPFVHRPDFWESFVRSLDIWESEGLSTCSEAVELVRQRTREHGRESRVRTISRPVLVKGLEYDHSVILSLDGFDAQDFYVAATRGRSSLTVFSDSPTLQFPKPEL